MLWIQNNLNMLRDLKTDTFEHCRHSFQLHMHEFSNSVGLLSRLHLSDEELQYEPRETVIQQNSSNPHKEIKIAQLHQQICFYIIFAFVNTIG